MEGEREGPKVTVEPGPSKPCYAAVWLLEVPAEQAREERLQLPSRVQFCWKRRVAYFLFLTH